MSEPNDETLVGTRSSGDQGVLKSKPHPVLVAGDVVGRFVVFAELGAGGMGVVYAAYDPELDRKVALKLLRRDPTGSMASNGRARLLREAQALARFSHPEIVAVYDVGEHEAGVWLAMEFVDGVTLGAWAKQARRRWPEVVAIMQLAGRGVAAAHAAGLIHRDLKPDNIMIASDGRVRVMDFGLTRPQGGRATLERELAEMLTTEDRTSHAHGVVPGAEAGARTPGLRRGVAESSGPLTELGSLIGTPAYMAPEQFAGAEVTPATDQFAFCVTLWELLYGERPFAGRSMIELASAVIEGQRRPVPRGTWVPYWLRKLCERGLASDPHDRWPSMQALLSALERGARAQRRRLIGLGLGIVALLGGAAEGWRRYDHARAVSACEGEGDRIATTWNDGAREQVRAGLLGTEVAYAARTADAVIPALDGYAQVWEQRRTEVCVRAEVDDELDAQQYERALWCLDERRYTFESLVAEFSHADLDIVRMAVSVTQALDRVDPCVDEQVLATLSTPPSEASREQLGALRAELARIRVLSLAGKYTEGLAAIQPARAEAEDLAWAPLIAVTRGREGWLLQESGDSPGAEAASVDAYLIAARASAWDVAADTATDLVEIVGDSQVRFAEGRLWAQLAKVAISHAGDPVGLRGARLATNLGHLELGAGRYDEVENHYTHALEVWTTALGPDHPTIGVQLNNLGNLERYRHALPAARAHFERALDLREGLLGPDHPEIAGAQHNLGMVLDEMGEDVAAEQLLTRALRSWEQTFGPDHEYTAMTVLSLGNIALGRGEYDQAKHYYARTLASFERTLGPDHPNNAAVLNNLATVAFEQGELEPAKQMHERALTIREHSYGLDHPSVATSLFNLASVVAALGQLDRARALHERALAINETTFGADHPETAWALAEIATLDVELDQPERAVPILERALVIFDANEGEQGGEALARFTLARALLATGGDLDRARAQAERAREGFRADGEAGAKDLAKVEAWLAANAGSNG